jgi:hypothetical protein
MANRAQGFNLIMTIDEDAVDGLLTAEECDAEYDDLTLYAEYRRLAAEQAALRRVATLVARGVEPLEVFGAVAEEMRRCVPAVTAGLWRFDTDGEITIVAAAAHPAALAKWPVGTRTAMEGTTLAALVQRRGGAARIDRLRQRCRADRCSRARGGRERGGGGADHR